jgi:DNA-directed RNA polymerase subunit RPC12/RpoP
MNISCNNCGKVHKLPDESVKNKKVYFFCSACRHKIIVDARTKISEQLSNYHSLANFTDIFNGLFSFFNWGGVLISSLHIIFSVLIVGITSQIITRNLDFFINYPLFGLFIVILIFLIIFYSRNIVLYYISKIQINIFNKPEAKYVDWKSINFDFEEDSLILLMYTSIPVAVLFFILLPIPYLNTFGIFYAGLFYPVIFITILALVFIIILFRFMPSFLAAGSFFIRDGIKEMINFIKREFVEIPFYWIVITVVSKFFGFIFLGIYSVVIIFSGSILFTLLPGEAKDSLQHILSSLPMMGLSKSGAPIHVSFGIVFLIIMVFLSFVLFLAMLDNFIQALYSKTVVIMNKNPRESFNRTAMLVILLSIILFTLLGVTILINIPSTIVPMFLNNITGI